MALTLGVSAGAQAALWVDGEAPGGSVAFAWDAVDGAERYQLRVGRAPGGRELGTRSSTVLGAVAQALPTDGAQLHASLWARRDGRWQRTDSLAFTAADEPLLWTRFEVKGEAAVFPWRDDLPADAKVLITAGTAEDDDAYGRRAGKASDAKALLTGLPVDGSEVHLTLRWRDGVGRWRRERPVVFQAAEQPLLRGPVPGSRLPGSAAQFFFEKIPYNDGARVKLGTASAPSAYRVWPRKFFFADGEYAATQLPLDGSEVIARYEVLAAGRWREVARASYQAAWPSDQTLWGDCTDTGDWGDRTRVRLKPGDRDDYWLVTDYTVAKTLHPRLDALLRDGCAADDRYVSVGKVDFRLLQDDGRGLYFWLAPDSGPAVLSWTVPSQHTSARPYLRALPATGDTAFPVHVPIDSHRGELAIQPLDPARPVKIAEIRAALDSDDISLLRKGRWSTEGSGGFYALNGDPRARVTAEIAKTFEPWWASDYGPGFYAGADTCGFFRWIDATWEIDQRVQVQLSPPVIWVNWQQATNEAIWEAINASIDYGETHRPKHVYGQPCTRADGALIYQNWEAKASAALAGSYDGPVLRYE